jgi:hypothetical protein
VIRLAKPKTAYRYVVIRSTGPDSWAIASRHRTSNAASRAASRPGPGLPLDLGAEAERFDVGSRLPDAIVVSRLDAGTWTDLSGLRSKRLPAWTRVADDWLAAVKEHPEETLRRLARGSDEEVRTRIQAGMKDVPQLASKEAKLSDQVFSCRRQLDALTHRFTWWYQLSKQYGFLDHVDDVAHPKAQPPTEFGVVLDGAWLDLTVLRPSRPTSWHRITVDWLSGVPVGRDEIVRRLAKAPEWRALRLLSEVRSAETTGDIDSLFAEASALRDELGVLSEARPTGWYRVLIECAQAHVADAIDDEIDAAWRAMMDTQQGIWRGLGAPLNLDSLPDSMTEEARFFTIARCDYGHLLPAITLCAVHLEHGTSVHTLPLCVLHAAQAGCDWNVHSQGPAGACDECLTGAFFQTAWERLLDEE